ncbi:hypothetical protein [Agaribacterium sp. ZY112]|uniref:hypothetical protein n=1 Tax=Agaribacterium sp. ZY112 TaxID=3233574 RepID=UPI0035238CAA
MEACKPSSKTEEKLNTLASLFDDDLTKTETERVYPNNTRASMQDKRVLQVLAEVFESGMEVSNVFELLYNPHTKLHHTVFATYKEGQEPMTSGVLVITDFNQQVVGVVDPFEIPKPGSDITIPLEKLANNNPFVLLQPSAAEQVLSIGRTGVGGDLPGPKELPPIEWEYPGRIPGVDLPDLDFGGFSPGGLNKDNSTSCSYSTAYQTAVQGTCTKMTGLLLPTCDSYGVYYVADARADEEQDDSGHGSFRGGLNFPW